MMANIYLILILAALAVANSFVTSARAQATAEESMDFMFRACFETAPTFAQAQARVTAAGGVRIENETMQSLNARLEEPRFIGLWSAPEPHPKDWIVGLAEGHLGDTPAHSCFAFPGLATVPQIQTAINARWPLVALSPPQEGLIYNTWQSFWAEINGTEALIIFDWSGNRATSSAYVTVVIKSKTKDAAAKPDMH
jgi:hypothetical protein